MRLLVVLCIAACLLCSILAPVLSTPVAATHFVPGGEHAIQSSGEEDADLLEDVPDERDVDMRSLFNAMFTDTDEEEDSEETVNAREARSGKSTMEASDSDDTLENENRAVADAATVAKYNNFADLFYRRVNAELRKQGDPLKVVLTAGGKNKSKNKSKNKKGKNKKGKNNKGKNKKGNNKKGNNKKGNNKKDQKKQKKGKDKKNKKTGSGSTVQRRQSKDMDLEEQEGEEPAEDTEFVETREKRDVEDEQETADVSSRQSKDLDIENLDNEEEDEGESRFGRGLGMEKRKKQQRVHGRKKGGNNKNNAGNRRNKIKNKQANKSENKKSNKGNNKNKNKRGSKQNSSGNKKKSINKRSKTSSGPAAAAAKLRRSQTSSRVKLQARRTPAAASKKSSKKGNKGGATRAIVTGFSTLTRRGPVTISQSNNVQKITSDFTMGPIGVDVTRSFGGSETKSAQVTSTSMSGTVVIEVTKTGRAKIAKLRVFPSSNLKISGSLSRTGGKKNDTDSKVLKASIKRVSPKISKKIKAAAKSVLQTSNTTIKN